ncbi:MAG: hypothetical protein Q4A63_05795 [Butyricicoccus pullicaecorum]|nr:hypothetical protein [Butyricicoccus pullicaecorum]MBS5149427.1 hypothetical protein [Butyricicoccus pullicaecorum]MDO4669310.1 hypothetical protein [Butyricicoccus pullicaecorum]
MQIGYDAFDSDLGRYFRTLPKNVQESIMQSGVVFHTEQDMRRCAEHFMQTRN